MMKPVRHILSLSGGKDSAALAVHMRDRVPNMEYIFHDTAKELPVSRRVATTTLSGSPVEINTTKVNATWRDS